MTNQNKLVIKLMAQNMFRHPNFWNVRNFKNRLHVLVLMMMPVSCKDEKLKQRYESAKLNFWSACGDSVDYLFFVNSYNRLKNCRQK